MKQVYERAALNVVTFDTKDVIVTSGGVTSTGGPIELPSDLF